MNSSLEGKSDGSLPSIWDPQFIMSFTPSFSYEDEHASRLEALKEDVKSLIASTSMGDPGDLLKLIDTIQRLGVSYHFEKEIEEALRLIHPYYIPTDLYHTALHFRLLRDNGFSINSDVFNKFMDKDGKFMDNLREDVEGLLSLFEAAHLGIPGEDILEEAKNFSTNHLKVLLITGKLETKLAEKVQQSLEVPLHWRMARSEARNFIDAYQKDNANNSVLLELAKLDYNVLQSIYLKDLKELAEWEIKGVEELPEYMKICYLALYNSVAEVVQDASTDLGLDVLPYVKDKWITYCRGMLKQARWNQSGYMPTFDEYLKNAWTTIGILVGLTISYFGIGESIIEYLPHIVENWSTSELFYRPSLIARLVDDLMTSKVEMKRGEVVNSIQCYMIEHGVSEEEAEDHIKGLISYSRKKLNELLVLNSYPLRIMKLAMDMSRCVHRIYKYDDFFGIQTKANIDCVDTLLFESIPME